MSGELIEREQQAVVVTPMTMIEMAVRQGANVDQLQKLFELQLSWERNEARKAFVVALNAFKANPPRIAKDKSVSFGAGKTSYKHATLDNASEAIGASLSAHGLSHRWTVEQVEGGVVRVTCVLQHILGHSESVTMQASPDTSGSKNSIQAIGSTTSYLQRYTLFAATGIAPKDADDDGNQGRKGMRDDAKAGFVASIAACTDSAALQSIWTQIAEACREANDLAAYEELKALVIARTKAIKAEGETI